ncbi:hypothetical protein PF010_g6607 [Phytophthora fragariae]|uniref:HECT-type E3 ubiquitin transferase n=1 Tax=Phytophthora fragariae TaxID=53985 RepID=A0A6A3LHZ8_9STRA|nr:hypothetical protein PF011_g6028 [Phytophthora fragariae]KAE9122814.1 hypothetical protein PF010_g6607 [Phytophthora fragariae]KAE9243367.1 hypothetical protein PF002_g8284 [Phytophthora fragariae]
MAELLVLLIVASQVTLYLLIGFMFRALQRKYQERSSSELQQALIAREETTGEHRIDIATLEAEEEVVRCRVCAFANTQRFRFCVICGEKLKLSPTERARARSPLTARQLRARRRSEWQRQMKCGQVFWHREAARECFQYPGYVPVFCREDDTDTTARTEVVVEPPDGKSGWMIAKLRNETRLMKIQIVPAEEANALEFATGAPSSRNVDIKGFLDLSKEDFPTKFAHFVACTSSLIVPAELEVLKLFLRREHVVEESMEYFCCMDDNDTRAVVRIDFAAETGVDAGGVHREWFTLVTELIIDPSLGVFTLGRLVGRALLDGEVMGFHFAPALLKIVLGIPLTFRDYEDLDPTTYKSLLWMLENDGADTLGLDFTVTRKGERGEVVTAELVPNGGEIPVTDSNKHSFAEHWLRYFLLESVSDQLYVFLKGLYQVIPRQILMLFDAEEFDYVLCGCDTIDVTDWETNTRCSRNLTGTRVLRWFWELVRDMNPECLRRLLQFATGCSRVPIGGFRHLTSHDGQICPFTLKGVHSAYIRSHACFNRLDLPLASTRAELKEVLHATLSTETYGFTTA